MPQQVDSPSISRILHFFRRNLTAPIASIVWLVLAVNLCAGQQLPGEQKPKAKPPGQKPKIVIPEPETLNLLTRDKVKLVCSYFAPPINEEEPEAGKTTIPFIVLHDWEGDRRQTYNFAKYLQSKGHAAIVPDLRGHGASTQVEGLAKPIAYDSIKRNQMAAVINDIETCKKFLVQKNNDAELNIDLLSVVAIGELAPVAVEWTIRDWYQFPPFNANGIKQGQDVKAVVLVAPEPKFATYNLTKLIKHPLFAGGVGKAFPVMVVWSAEDENTARTSEAIYDLLEKARPDVPDTLTAEQKIAATTLFKAKLEKLDLPGPAILASERVDGLWNYIASTVQNRINVDLERNAWTDRDPDDE